jgi:Flp pilus assembly protein TadG
MSPTHFSKIMSFSGKREGTSRRRGVVMVYVALCIVMLLAMTGMAVDMSRLYLQRAKAQRAADAAALAGAMTIMRGDFDSDSDAKIAADEQAQKIAGDNGYSVANGATFSSVYPAQSKAGWYEVTLSKQEPLYFMPILGIRTQLVAAPATAAFTTTQPVNLSAVGVGTYGSDSSILNLSLYGPYAAMENGDAFSPLYLDSVTAKYIAGAKSGDANPNYNPNGYDFYVNVPSSYSSTNGGNTKVNVEIFDPDTYNNGGNDALRNVRVDEIRDSPFRGSHPLATTTQYSLYYTNGTADPSDDILISQKSYGGDSSTDMKWVQPNGFQFDITDSRWADKAFDSNSFRLNVRSTDGTSENGFLLRAGPPRSGDSAFDDKNGTSITAEGRIPINFNDSGVVTVQLGEIPAGSSAFTVTKFDTDVGSKSITYSDGVNTYTGTLSDNGQFLTDSYTLPANYPGGKWTATYTAGRQDTSSWSMSYTGPTTGTPGSGSLRLVQ